MTLFEQALITLFVCILLLGCGSRQNSSGFQLERDAGKLPPGVPARVGVVPFAGESPLNLQATDQFTEGLLGLGFNVIERNNLQAVIDELELSHTDMFSESTRTAMGKQLGVEAIFTGSVTGERSAAWVDTYVNIKLVDIETGRVLWAATAQDPRRRISRRKIRADVNTSITHSVRQALKMLQNDLSKIQTEE